MRSKFHLNSQTRNLSQDFQPDRIVDTKGYVYMRDDLMRSYYKVYLTHAT